MAQAIPKNTEYVGAEAFADFLAEVLRDNLPGGIYIETGDEGAEVFVISQGERSAGVYSVKVTVAELKVADG